MRTYFLRHSVVASVVVVIIFSGLLTAGSSLAAPSFQAKVDQIEPGAGTWKTWVLTSGSQFRLPEPPDNASTEAEIKQLKDLVVKRDAAALDQIAYWETGAPSYRWNEITINEAIKYNISANLANRDLALVHVAMYDALVAAWDSKYMYNRLRPSQVDPSLTTVLPNPDSPSYPSENAVAAGAASTVLAYIFPDDAASFGQQAQAAAQSRVLAGVEYPSDVQTGLELGQKVGALLVERGKANGSDAKWTDSVPTEKGKWTGTAPIEPMGGTWETWVLTSGSEIRPAPPPAYDSAQETTEMAEVVNFKRTPKSNADAFFWQYAAGGLRNSWFWSKLIDTKLFEYRLDKNPVRAARAYALIYTALNDSSVACWDAKYFYWAMRPVQIDSTFKPLFTTPNHPSYPSGHSCISNAATQVLSYLFPRDAKLFDAMAVQAGEARIWAGIHFRSDLVAGKEIGTKVAQKVIERAKSDGSQ